MKEKNKVKIICVTITAIFSMISVSVGKVWGESRIDKEISQVVTINNGDYATAIESIVSQNKELTDEVNVLTDKVENQELEISALEEENGKLKTEEIPVIEEKDTIEISTSNLIINGIDSGYSNKVAIVNNEMFYSRGFLEYIVDNQAVSSNNSKVFIGSVHEEEKIAVPLISLTPFAESRDAEIMSNVKDTLDNVYDIALVLDSSRISAIEELGGDYLEYKIDNKYSKLKGKIAHGPDDAYMDAYLLIYGDEKLIHTSPWIDVKTEPFEFEVDISGYKYIAFLAGNENNSDLTYPNLILSDFYLYP